MLALLALGKFLMTKMKLMEAVIMNSRSEV